MVCITSAASFGRASSAYADTISCAFGATFDNGLGMLHTNDPQERDTYSDKETAARAEAALKRMLATPPKLHKDSKVGAKRKMEKPE